MHNTNAEKIPFLRDPDKLAILYQLLTVIGIGLLSYYLISNTLTNLEKQNISTGFSFLEREAAFEIGETLISYSAADSYGKALLVGFLNTLIVSFIGIVLTVLLGTVLGIARLSSNWLVARLSAIYIEVFQDIPILLQLFFWYAFFYEILPGPRQALTPIPGVFLCNRGLIFGVPAWHSAYQYAILALVLGGIIVFFLKRWATARQAASGQIFPLFRASLLILTLLPLVAWWLGGAPTTMSVPELKGFNFQGGVSISPEFTALLLGLVLYTAAFVAEVVRAGIQSVGKGQREAALSIGLRQGQVLNLVILPRR
jgi:general L-amino acid transport system permease protein